MIRQVPSVSAESVTADRIIRKPYLEIDLDRKAVARYGMDIPAVQRVIEVALGGVTLTSPGRGSDIMVPMALPIFGGMVVALLSVFIVPVLYCARREYALGKRGSVVEKSRGR